MSKTSLFVSLLIYDLIHNTIGQEFSVARAFIMKILYDFYISRAYSHARVKKSKKVNTHTSQRLKRLELIQVSLA